jgi:hypothetical protein
LLEVPWKPVEDEAVGGVVLSETLTQDRDCQLVRHELARRENRLYLLAELGAGRDRGAKNVPGGHVRDAVLGRDALRLRALARTLRAEDENVEGYLRKPS